MRKFRNILLTVLVIVSSVTAYGATYTLTSANYPINVNGQKLAVEPLNMNGTTYLPLRSISDAVGVPISWNDASKSVEINTVDIEALKKACVTIYAGEPNTMGEQGSGVYADYDKVLTAQHIIDGAKRFGTMEEEYSSLISQDKILDVAVLKPASEKKPVKIGDSDEVGFGDRVIVVSSPGNREDTVSYATVQTPANGEMVLWGDGVGKGSSGGGVFTLSGELIGIVTAGDDGRLFMATPINDIRKAL